MSDTAKEKYSTITYCCPIKNVIIHFAICSMIASFISVVFYQVIFYISGHNSSSNSIFLGLSGGFIGMLPVVIFNMPSKIILTDNKKYLVRYVEQTIDQFMVDDRMSGFGFGYKTKKMDENEYLIIPQYYQGVPQSIRFFEDGNGYLLKFFKVQTCLEIKIVQEGAEVVGPYRSLKILRDNF